MKSMSISMKKRTRRTNLKHNNRESISKNVDRDRLNDNWYHQEDIKAVYKELFDDAVEDYNSKQKRKDRHIKDYYEKINYDDNKTEVQQELIVQIGDMSDMKVGDETWNECKEILQEYVRTWNERNPNLRAYNIALHLDESTPHLHINFVPFYHAKTGLSKRVGMDKALTEQGMNTKHPFKEWRVNEVDYISKLMQEREMERKLVGKHKDYDLPQFREAMAVVETLNTEIQTLNQEVKVLEEKKNSLEKSFVFEDYLDIKKNSKGTYNNEDVEQVITYAKALYLQDEKHYELSKSTSSQLEIKQKELIESKKQLLEFSKTAYAIRDERDSLSEQLEIERYTTNLALEKLEKEIPSVKSKFIKIKSDLNEWIRNVRSDLDFIQDNQKEFLGGFVLGMREYTSKMPQISDLTAFLGKTNTKLLENLEYGLNKLITTLKQKRNDIEM